MKKITISILLTLSFIFSGCSSWCEVEVPVYMEATCPKIEVLKIVAPVEITVDSNGSISKKSIPGMLKGLKQLRKSETYYYEQVTKYNKEFTTVDKLEE